MKLFITLVIFFMYVTSISFYAQVPRCPVVSYNSVPPIEKFAQSNLTSLNITIPVIFHVIHATNGQGNISSTLIQDQIDVLNNAYSNQGISFFLMEIDRVQNNDWFYNLEFSTTPTQYEINVKQDLSVYPKYINIY